MMVQHPFTAIRKIQDRIARNPDGRHSSAIGRFAISHCAAETDKRRAAHRAKVAELMRKRVEEIAKGKPCRCPR